MSDIDIIDEEYKKSIEDNGIIKMHKKHPILSRVSSFIIPALIALCLYFINTPFVTAGYAIVLIIDVIMMFIAHIFMGFSIIGMFVVGVDEKKANVYKKSLPSRGTNLLNIFITMLSRGSIVLAASYFIRPYLLIWAAITFTSLTIFSMIMDIFNTRMSKNETLES